MGYKGKYQIKNPHKYRGNLDKLIYKSLLERRYMKYCDENASILSWSYEKNVIAYISPIDKRFHRYYVDFFTEYMDKNGKKQILLVEIKPDKETKEPVLTESSKKNGRYKKEVFTYGINQAKWESARKYCDKRGWKFIVLTEKDLGRTK